MSKERKKAIRASFRDAVFSRDGNKCVICAYAEDLAAHHISDRNEMPSGGYVKENGITVCAQCHLAAESYAETQNPAFHPDRLYSLIGSSRQAAIRASQVL
jgi:5-methylcytosine-specific restriction endonuclease McrA